MMSKHSTGPWVLQTIETNHNGYDWPTFAIRDSIANYCLAVVGEVDRATAEVNEANAKLISAAPELLTALKDLVESIEAEEDFSFEHGMDCDGGEQCAFCSAKNAIALVEEDYISGPQAEGGAL